MVLQMKVNKNGILMENSLTGAGAQVKNVLTA